MWLTDLFRTTRPRVDPRVQVGTVNDVATGAVAEGWATLHTLRFSTRQLKIAGVAVVYDRSFDTACLKIGYAGDPGVVRLEVGDLECADVSMRSWPGEWREAYQTGRRALVAARELKVQDVRTIEVTAR